MFFKIPKGIGMRSDETEMIVSFRGRLNAQNEFRDLEIQKTYSVYICYPPIIR